MAGLRPGRCCAPPLLVVILLTPLSLRAEGEIAVIASRAWEQAQEIDLPTLRRVYLGRVTQLFGRRVERIHLRLGSPTREAFSVTVLGKSGMALEDYWVEQALRGGRAPPLEVADREELIRTVGARPGVLGYLRYADLREEDAARVRVLAIRSQNRTTHPREVDYPLREEEEASGP